VKRCFCAYCLARSRLWWIPALPFIAFIVAVTVALVMLLVVL